MSLPAAMFPVATFEDMGPTAFVLAVIRAECDPKGRCHKDQRFLAGKAGRMPIGTFGYHIAKLKKRGVIVVIRGSRRKKGVILIRPEHRWVTPEKSAPKPSECSNFSNTSSKASFRKKEAPAAPADAGEPASVFEKEGEGEPNPFGPCERCGVERQAPAPAPCRHCASTRRTPYGQPRQPRGPRLPRRRQRATEIMAAAQQAAERLIEKRFGPAEAPLADRLAVPPPPEIIPPDTGEVIAFPRQAAPRPRGFSPATDIMEAAYHAAERLIAERFPRDGCDHRHTASALSATGRDAASPRIDPERLD
jgi:hypothetical protein